MSDAAEPEGKSEDKPEDEPEDTSREVTQEQLKAGRDFSGELNEQELQ
ncbi:MAG: hypothetical protein VYC68_04725 [Candidatus Thermoplasmatota archaeon]|nr:hypothetical protein [Candidatus Thermoplasmatota archaeon]